MHCSRIGDEIHLFQFCDRESRQNNKGSTMSTKGSSLLQISLISTRFPDLNKPNYDGQGQKVRKLNVLLFYKSYKNKAGKTKNFILFFLKHKKRWEIHRRKHQK